MADPSFLIIANGEWPPQRIWEPLKAQCSSIIVCDGAAAQCLENGVEMNVIIGDMDSLSQRDETQIRDGGKATLFEKRAKRKTTYPRP